MPERGPGLPRGKWQSSDLNPCGPELMFLIPGSPRTQGQKRSLATKSCKLGLRKFSLSGPSDSQHETEPTLVKIQVPLPEALNQSPRRPSRGPVSVLSG